ncbi:evolutionarily conserved signaling intermediate in Toll pathway, mitochondrial [Tribolium madens]|uniref:evolutionarily conserved signaling intermediate in Toll pathway, mitochondrial n=1 Tax=Tribolium madens TaxID=41895 RepID=UPI001CF75ECD|nr:evolutionarily conserved signaling intermediate in Toll pathway, mitochondrial [Tribolium madens]
MFFNRLVRNNSVLPKMGLPLYRTLCEKPTQVVTYRSFEEIETKNKNTYLDMIHIFINRDNVYRRGHVEFIYSALKNMEQFGVHKDIEVYKALIDVLPKGKFIPRNMFQVEFMHYPKQQQCIIDLLEQMEDNGVMPDYDMEDLLKNIFGNRGFPLRKYWRMMYWMPKFKNASPWPLPNPLPEGVYELAKCAIERISSVDIQTQITTYQSREEDTWIISAQAPIQKDLLKRHDVTEPLYVEGPFRVWLKNQQVTYFTLRKNSKLVTTINEDLDDVSDIKIPLFGIKPIKKLTVVPSVHEQEDGTILGLCATGTSTKDSLVSWIRNLEKDGNPVLGEVPIVFTLRSGSKEIVTLDSTKQIENK